MRVTLILVSVLLISGCNSNELAQSQVNKSMSLEASNGDSLDYTVLATVQGQPLKQSEIDRNIQLELYQLDWAAYELRRDAVSKEVEARTSAQGDLSVNVLMRPPMPPRLDVPERAVPTIGPEDAPVTLSIFCNYQSLHCLRMQPIYQRLAAMYPDELKFEFYELPLPFHRQALGASVAATCAQEQNQFEGFHQAMWSANNHLNDEIYLTTAKQLNMNIAAFEDCLQQESHYSSVQQGIDQAFELGFKNVPVTLVNGLYASGPKDENVLRYFIDQELTRLSNKGSTIVASDQSSKADQSPAETELPLRLEGLLFGSNSSEDSAMIQTLADGSTKTYLLGETLLDEVRLHSIHKGFVLLKHDGVLEKLSLKANADERVDSIVTDDVDQFADIERATIASGNVLDTDEPPPPDLDFQYRGVVAPAGVKPLSKSWLSSQLEQKEELLSHFKPAELEVEGVRIMRLENVGDNEFYKTLGLQEKDVIMRVNGQWVHEQNNNLFSSLEAGEEVSVVLMRRGLPVHYAYQVN